MGKDGKLAEGQGVRQMGKKFKSFLFSIFFNKKIKKFIKISFQAKLFTNRKNFTYNTLQINISGIGDSVTGGTKVLGDTGTFPVGTGGTGQWNLSESQVNYLVAGLDYTGTGISISWTQGQKVYWMENAKISSANLNPRYINYYIGY